MQFQARRNTKYQCPLSLSPHPIRINPMRNILKKSILAVLLFLKPILAKCLLGNEAKISSYQAEEREAEASGMVTEFNFLHKLIYQRFFRRVRTVRTDITRVKDLTRQGPVVFVMKNRGQLEYRYFNTLFLKEKIEPIAYANGVITVLWRPRKKIWRFVLARLATLYTLGPAPAKTEEEEIAEMVARKKNVLINLSISRDYLFGLFNTNPLAKVAPLLDVQRGTDTPITIVPMQFLYDKHPEKVEKTFFDFLFGEKSRPGALRKTFLFFMSIRKNPQAKFGEAIDLKGFVGERGDFTSTQLTEALYQKIEDSLAIERARITGPKLKSKDTTIAEILKDQSFIENLRALSQDSGETFESLRGKAKRYLNEIAADVNYSAVHFVWLALSYLWNNIFDGLVIKHDQLNRIREVAGKHPVVLAPMHRSHIDYLLISDLFYGQNITFPHICAGINLNFWPVGGLIRKCGGFFIRRRFEGNTAYKESFYSYVKHLINNGYCLEFFIEGTRSRTGKLLKPKFGVLSQMMRAYVESERDDIYFVPIAINYDQILEQKAYVSEGAGSEKSKEDATELLKVRKVFGKKYGKVYIEFAEPISLKEFLAKKGIGKDARPEEIRGQVEEFGYHLTYHINKVAIVTPIALVSLAILSLGKKTFGFEELIDRVQLLKDYLDFKNVTYSDLIHYSDRWAYNEAVQILEGRNLIKEVKTFEENFYTVEPAARSQLDYYKNNILHFFVSLTCFCKILTEVKNQSEFTMDFAVKKYELLKKLFENDFTFSARVSIEEHLRRVMDYAASRGLIRIQGNFAAFTKTVTELNRREFETYLSLMDNFLESHLIVLRYLKYNRFENLEAGVLIKDILEKSRPLYLKDDLAHPEALNRFNLENSFKLMTDIGLLELKSQDKGKPGYTSISDVEMIEKWIQSVQGFLKLKSSVGDMPMTARTDSEAKSQIEEGLH